MESNLDKIRKCLSDVDDIMESDLKDSLKVKIILGKLINMSKSISKQTSKSKTIKLDEDDISHLMKRREIKN